MQSSRFTDHPTRELARFTSGCAAADLDATQRSQALDHIIDTVVACRAGADQVFVEAAAQVLKGFGRLEVAAGVPVIGRSWKCDPMDAAYLMAVAAHALEMDDGNREGSIHPGAVIVPAALSMAHFVGASADELIAACVAGYEVTVSIAERLHPHASRRGFQTTPVAGVIGAAAAAARLLKLDADTTEMAFGIAASSSAGIFAYLNGGGNIKKIHPGHAAREGLLAAFYARDGLITGPKAVIETGSGVLQAFGGLAPGSASSTAVVREELAIVRSYLKPYPCCRHIHPAVDALLDMRRETGFKPAQIKRIDIGTYNAAMPHADLPWDTLNIAQLSFPYVMAVAALDGAVDLASFSDAARVRPEIEGMARKVHVRNDAECDRLYPARGPARVQVEMEDGRTLLRGVDDPLGAPEQPIPQAQLQQKFLSVLTPSLGEKASRDWLSALRDGKNPRVSDWMAPLSNLR